MSSQASLSKTGQKGTGQKGNNTPSSSAAASQQASHPNGVHNAPAGEMGDETSAVGGRNAQSAVVRPRSAAALASSQAPEWESR